MVIVLYITFYWIGFKNQYQIKTYSIMTIFIRLVEEIRKSLSYVFLLGKLNK